MKRRQFLKAASVGVGSAVALVLDVDDAHAGKVVSIPLPASLKKVNGWTVLQVSGKKLLLMRTSSRRVRGVAALCTHRRCELGYAPSRKRVVCPCHSSEFDTKGRVLKSPAAKNLTRYKCKIKGNTLYVKFS